MDTSRTVETWWNRGDGQSSINQATDHAVKVYNQDGSWDSQDLTVKHWRFFAEKTLGFAITVYIDGDGSSYLRNPTMTEGMNIYKLFWDSLGHQVFGGDICFLGGAYLLFGFFGWRKDLHIDTLIFTDFPHIGLAWVGQLASSFFEMAMKSQEMRSFTTES